MEFAKDKPIELIDGQSLISLLQKYGIGGQTVQSNVQPIIIAMGLMRTNSRDFPKNTESS